MFGWLFGSQGKGDPCGAKGSPQAAPAWASVLETRHDLLADAQVVPEADKCVQCGCCSYNCPMGIDVRAHAWRGLPIHDSHCLTCSECVKRCPRGVLRFERIALLPGKTPGNAGS